MERRKKKIKKTPTFSLLMVFSHALDPFGFGTWHTVSRIITVYKLTNLKNKKNKILLLFGQEG